MGESYFFDDIHPQPRRTLLAMLRTSFPNQRTGDRNNRACQAGPSGSTNRTAPQSPSPASRSRPPDPHGNPAVEVVEERTSATLFDRPPASAPRPFFDPPHFTGNPPQNTRAVIYRPTTVSEIDPAGLLEFDHGIPLVRAEN